MNDKEIKQEIEDWVSWLSENNTEDIEVNELIKISDLCDYALVGTVMNSRHMSHLSESAMRRAKDLKAKLIHADGLDNKEWVVLDFGIYIIHLFLPETREKYNLNELWNNIHKEKKEETI